MAGQGKDGVMLDWLTNGVASMFATRKPEMVENPHCPAAGHAALEARISEAGRERVFDIVRENGRGSDSAPPPYIWWQACDQAIKEKAANNLAKPPSQGLSSHSNTAHTHDDK